MVYLDLSNVFIDFTTWLDRKLKWSGIPKVKSAWTKTIFSYFSDLLNRQGVKEDLLEKYNYLNIDYVWIYEKKVYPQGHYIELALEHENQRNIKNFLTQEVQHLIDIKADNKIAITYPYIGQEKRLVADICNRIRWCIRKTQSEEYLIILGYPTKIEKKPAINFKGYIINDKGNELKRIDSTIHQKH